jgi:hypothetical protein
MLKTLMSRLTSRLNIKINLKSLLRAITFIIATVPIAIVFQNCSPSDKVNSLSSQADELSTNLSNQQQRADDLEIVLKGMIEEEKNQRIQADDAINSRVDSIASDLAQYKVNNTSSVTELQNQSNSIKKTMDSNNSEFNNRINDLSNKNDSLSRELNGRIESLDGNLRSLIKGNSDYLEARLISEREKLLAELRENQKGNNTQFEDLAKRTLANELSLSSLAKSHEEFKAFATQNFATKVELSQVKSMYDQLVELTDNLNIKIDVTSEKIEKRLGDRIQKLSSRVEKISKKVDRQGKSISDLRSDLRSAIVDYRNEIRELSEDLQNKIDSSETRILHIIREENDELKNEMFEALNAQSLELTIYTRKSVNIMAQRIKSLEAELNANTAKDEKEAEEIRAALKETRENMTQAIAEEQVQRNIIAQQVQQLSQKVQRIEKDLIETQNLARQNAENIKKLKLDFQQEKIKVADRFKAERAETDKKLDQLNKKFQEQLQKVLDKTDRMTRELGEDIREQMRKVVTDVAAMKSRVSNVESSLKNMAEEIQNDRARTFQLQSDLQKPREQASQAIVGAIRALGSLQLEFIKTLSPDDENPGYYNESFKPIMELCDGDLGATTPNAMGLDSFQVLSIEYARLLLLGERTGNEKIDNVFFDFGSANEDDGLPRTIMLALLRYPRGSENESCLNRIQKWGRNIILKDEKFQIYRDAMSSNDQMARYIENLYEAFNQMYPPTDKIDLILAKAMEGLKDNKKVMLNIRSSYALELIDHAQTILALTDRTKIFEEFAQFRKDTAEDAAQEQAQIDDLRNDLNSFATQTDARLSKLESEVGALKTSLKRALDVLITLSDRAGYDDMKAYTRWSAQPLDYTPQVVTRWTPKISQIQHFFTGPLSLKNKTDACTGAKLMETGAGVQNLLQNGQYGICWVNFRNIPQKSWGNEVASIWFRLFGAATAINIKVDPAKQLEAKQLYTNYNYNRTFDFTNLDPNDPNLKLNGTFNKGAFDIKAPDVLKYFVDNIRTWSGIVLTFTPIRNQTIGNEKLTETGSPVDYRVMLFSPLVVDMKKNGRPQTIDSTNSLAKFDLLGNGEKVRTGWVPAHEGGLLALDLDKSGCIDSGKELFGEATVIKSSAKSSVKTAKNGFEALAQYDSNHDGVIDSKDPIYKKLVLWFDKKGTGTCQKADLVSLKKSGVKSISLNYQPVAENHRWQGDNDLRYVSQGSHKVYDIYFGFSVVRQSTLAQK